MARGQHRDAQESVTFTAQEFGLLVALAATCDPSDYPAPQARAVIEKAKHAKSLGVPFVELAR